MKKRRLKRVRGEKREYPGFIQKYEKIYLPKIAKKVPIFLNSDHFTMLAFISSVSIFLCYLFGPKHPYMYLVSIIFWIVHYIADSLDGTLARLRHQERPRYGYYVDHMLDSLSVFFMLAGIAFSGITNPFIWLLVIIVILLIFISSFLKVYVEDKFVVGIKFLNISGTEGRFAMIIFSVILFFYVNGLFANNLAIYLAGLRLNIVDIFGLIVLLIGLFSLAMDIFLTSFRLNKMDTRRLNRPKK